MFFHGLYQSGSPERNGRKTSMIGMSFASFRSLLILGIIASIVLHLIVRYKMLSGFDGFMNKWIAGWIGA